MGSVDDNSGNEVCDNEEDVDTVVTDDEETPTTPPAEDCPSYPVVWDQIMVDGVVLEVSSHGKVRPHKSSWFEAVDGFPYAGTPYKVYRVNHEVYFVHDLVWRAFRGHVPPGWSVRHVGAHALHTSVDDMFSNAIWNLEIYPDTVTQTTQGKVLQRSECPM